MKWDFDIFKVTELCKGKPMLFLGWAILASPHSQRIMKQHITNENSNKDSDRELEQKQDDFGYNFMELYRIPPQCLLDMLRCIEMHYNSSNPYHNPIHGADVLQTTHTFLKRMNAKELPGITSLHCFALLLGALIHDVGHPGLNNNYQTNAFSKLALRYNDKSILESFHVSYAFQLLFSSNSSSSNDNDNEKVDLNIFQNMGIKQFQECRQMMIDAVLDTDMAAHFTRLQAIEDIPPKEEWDFSGGDDSTINDVAPLRDMSWMLMTFAMHVADISNNAKDKGIAVQWTDRVLTEFFRQGDKEKEMGLPVSPLCDRETTSRPDSQLGFIEYIIRPSFRALEKHSPFISTDVIPIIDANYKYWLEEKAKEEEESATSDNK